MKKKVQNLIKMFKETITGSTGKLDHKRLTVFAFVLMFAGIMATALFKTEEIKNKELVETGLYVTASVIVGGMGLTKFYTKKDLNTNQDAIN